MLSFSYLKYIQPNCYPWSKVRIRSLQIVVLSLATICFSMPICSFRPVNSTISVKPTRCLLLPPLKIWDERIALGSGKAGFRLHLCPKHNLRVRINVKTHLRLDLSYVRRYHSLPLLIKMKTFWHSDTDRNDLAPLLLISFCSLSLVPQMI